MKTKKFAIFYNNDGIEYSRKELNFSETKMREVLNIESQYRAPFSLKLSSSSKQKYCATIGEPNDAYYIMIEWQDVPESDSECQEIARKYIREARTYFAPKDSEISAWLQLNCKSEWLFEKHMKEGRYLMAAEALHIMTQCFYGSAIHEPNIIRNLKEARKVLAMIL